MYGHFYFTYHMNLFIIRLLINQEGEVIAG
jgi:hypothetical protein